MTMRIRIDNIAAFGAWTLAAMLCVAPVAIAQTPTDAEIAQVQALLGFGPETTRIVVDSSFRQQPQFGDYDAKQQACLIDALTPEIDAELRNAFKTLFVDSETTAAWLRFGRTAGGGKFTGLMRAAVDAKLKGAMAPNPFSAIDGMSKAEQADISAFMQSPAASVLKKDFPDMPMPEAFGKRAAQRCGIQWPEQ